MSTVAKSEGRGSLFDNKQMVHIVSEVVVLLGITLYFSSKNKKLMNHIEELAQRLEQQDDRLQSLENSQKQNNQYIMKTLLEKLEQTNARVTALSDRIDTLETTTQSQPQHQPQSQYQPSVSSRKPERGMGSMSGGASNMSDAERVARLQRILKRAESEDVSSPPPVQTKTVFRPSSRNPSHLEPVTELNEEEPNRGKRVQFNIPNATGHGLNTSSIVTPVLTGMSLNAMSSTSMPGASTSSRPTIEDDDSDGEEDSDLDQEIQNELEELKNTSQQV